MQNLVIKAGDKLFCQKYNNNSYFGKTWNFGGHNPCAEDLPAGAFVEFTRGVKTTVRVHAPGTSYPEYTQLFIKFVP